MRSDPFAWSPVPTALQLARAAAALLLFLLAACTSAPSSSTDFVVLESQKFT